MKKPISILLCTLMLITLAACGEGKLPETPPSGPKETEAPTAAPTQAPTEAPTPVPPADPEAVVYPEKPRMTNEEQAVADKYYEELREVYPDFARIPRELLRESVSVDRYTSVIFTFCLGGRATNYRAMFSTGPRFPEGKWSIEGEDYAEYAGCVLTEGELASIRAMMFDSVSAYVEENKLDGSGLNAEDLLFAWQQKDGKLYAFSEFIANVTPETTASYGCVSHAHVFGSVLVEFTEGGAVLTDNGASGS